MIYYNALTLDEKRFEAHELWQEVVDLSKEVVDEFGHCPGERRASVEYYRCLDRQRDFEEAIGEEDQDGAARIWLMQLLVTEDMYEEVKAE